MAAIFSTVVEVASLKSYMRRRFQGDEGVDYVGMGGRAFQTERTGSPFAGGQPVLHI